MKVELLSRGGLARMKMWADSDELTEVKWYRASPDAKLMTGFHTFGHRFYSEGNEVQANAGDNDTASRHTGPGMQWPYEEDPAGCITGYPYANKNQPAAYAGQKRCGADRVWENGGKIEEDEHFQADDAGSIFCCETPGIVGTGGIGQGGAARTFPPFRGMGGTGGQRQGGAADITGYVYFVGLGGQGQGGSAVAGTAAGLLASGGQEQGGAADQLAAYLLNAAAGQQQGGEAAQGADYLLVGLRGQEQGGAADITYAFYLTGFGGQEQGGDATQTAAYLLAALRGEEQGGAATIVVAVPVTPPRVTQEVVEVLREGLPEARVTQEVVEVLRTGIPVARVTQEVVEVLRK